MGKTQKKFGKGRLDHYYRLAKEKGYRARSSFKILQLNEKYGFFTQPKGGKPRPMCVIDLCAAPGSWCQVATQKCPLNSLIVGVDLAPIKPLPNVISFQSDITTDNCRSQLRGYLKTWKADVVMHDGAPNVGMAWTQDAFTQSELVLQSLKLAIEFLRPGGWFVTKVFRSKDYNKLMWVFQQFFEKCEATKPPSSRNVSAEIFVVCRNFKAPKEIDPRLLDPHFVFEDLDTKVTSGQTQAKIFNPEKKRRSREGYDIEDGKLLIASKLPVMDFIKADDPVAFLGQATELDWDKSIPEVKTLKKLPQTTPDLIECLKDLRVLGKKDFRSILRWRLAARKLLGLEKPVEVEEEPEVELDTEEQIEKELEGLKDSEKARQKRERRKRNEEKQKAIMRMQLGMDAPTEIGIEAQNDDQGILFNYKTIKRATGNNTSQLVKGKQRAPEGVAGGGEAEFDFGDAEIEQAHVEESDSDAEKDEYVEVNEDDIDQLEQQLDDLYSKFKSEKLKNADAETLAKHERINAPWNGIESASEASDLDSDDEADQDVATSANTQMFFDKPIFNELEEIADSDNSAADTDEEMEDAPVTTSNGADLGAVEDEDVEMESEEERYDPTNDGEDEQNATIKMTLAHKLATGQITKHDLINEGYNKYSFRDTDGLPEWFLEDEKEHSRIVKPITKEAATALKERLKVLNARPIKKVAEATARKKMRAQRRLERIRKKSDLINEDEAKSEREKSEEIAKLFRKAKDKKQRPKVTVVAARGGNRALKGRPKGVKGKYKMVDGVYKKEQRALKRISKKRK